MHEERDLQLFQRAQHFGGIEVGEVCSNNKAKFLCRLFGRKCGVPNLAARLFAAIVLFVMKAFSTLIKWKAS